MTESVHVQRVHALPDEQNAAIAFHHDGTVIVYVQEDLLTPDGALALEAVLSQGRDEYHYQWGLPLVLAV